MGPVRMLIGEADGGGCWSRGEDVDDRDEVKGNGRE
jgi:hypothetical protein